MAQKTKQIIIALVIIVIAFVGFKKFFAGDSSDGTLAVDSGGTQFVDGQAILVLLNQLNRVTLDTSIFSDPIFASLVSFEQPIPDEVVGRANPFAPLGGEGVVITPPPRN